MSSVNFTFQLKRPKWFEMGKFMELAPGTFNSSDGLVLDAPLPLLLAPIIPPR